MADPYAAREQSPVGEQPLGDSPLPELLRGLGGAVATALAECGPGLSREARFIAIAVRDETLLPPLARIDSAFAVMLLLGPADGSHGARVALGSLDAAEVPLFLVKAGLVAGPAGREGAYVVEPELLESALAAALADRVLWEADRDFGYEVAAGVPGLRDREADAMCPRLLYAAADRVYEHAEAVAALKEARHRRVSAVPGVDPRIVAATGWPIEPTGSAWKD